jgi:hypothetical protein
VAKGGLGRWFGEKWTDVKTGQPCGRSSASDRSRPYPACRPAATASKMTPAQKATVSRKKTSASRVSWPVTPTGKRK